jgi:RimJ/RimL family protein N-acetyltransferase
VLDVLAVNERARALYERLGLTEVAPVSDGGVKIRMRSASRDAAAG